MKKTQQLMAAAAMLLIIISVLITSFQLVIYGDSEYKFYQKEYEKYTVCDALGMKMNDVMRVTEHMMASLVLLALLILTNADWKVLIPRAYSAALAIFLAIVAFLGIAFAIDFTKCFTIFHEIFFTNDLWMFDSATDYMIRMLPEGFFSDMVLRIGIAFIVMLMILWGIFRIWRVAMKDNNKHRL